MRYYKGDNFANLYTRVVWDLINIPDFVCSPRDQKIKEMLNVGIEIQNPRECLIKNEYRSSPLKYIAHELLLYFGGINSGEKFSEASKFWKKLVNEDGTVNSAYGFLIFNRVNEYFYNQWNWAKECLISDKDSRQAIMHYNSFEHQKQGIKDFVCTLSNQFFIREDKLYLSYLMRSQDIHFGMPIDVVWGYFLMEMMRLELLPTYPNLELGSYYHYAGSVHLYQRNFDIYEKALTKYNVFESEEFPAPIDVNLANEQETCRKIIDTHEYNGDKKLLKWLTKTAFE